MDHAALQLFSSCQSVTAQRLQCLTSTGITLRNTAAGICELGVLLQARGQRKEAVAKFKEASQRPEGAQDGKAALSLYYLSQNHWSSAKVRGSRFGAACTQICMASLQSSCVLPARAVRMFVTVQACGAPIPRLPCNVCCGLDHMDSQI